MLLLVSRLTHFLRHTVLVFLELLQAQVLALDEAFQVREGLLELLEDVGRSVAVTCRVILRVHRVHDYKHLLALRCLRIERPKVS